MSEDYEDLGAQNDAGQATREARRVGALHPSAPRSAAGQPAQNNALGPIGHRHGRPLGHRRAR